MQSCILNNHIYSCAIHSPSFGFGPFQDGHSVQLNGVLENGRSNMLCACLETCDPFRFWRVSIRTSGYLRGVAGTLTLAAGGGMAVVSVHAPICH
ncbi:hypothetical protein GDO81_029286 [Engystomops pustulosus]|uniref:Uncharacterized protein n=1 Tax=Engystomops pustulosus TaxID=76066 RepID=A0AAV6ZI67_ENGPU|nr:hypothetical protein GDO81_029286 [Engystomops pustulosus]